MTEIVGWIGSLLFALSALPQTIKTVRIKSAKDFSALFLGMWLVGELCMLYYSVAKLRDVPLFFNYICNLLCLLPIVYYKFRESKK